VDEIIGDLKALQTGPSLYHPPMPHPRRVAVVGAGIAGCGAAWSLDRAGFEVELFEARPTIGGNAKTHRWSVDGAALTTGLSVLAWPPALFRNYRRLLDALEVATEPVELRLFIRSGDEAHVPGGAEALTLRLADDFERWRRMIAWARKVNGVFHGRPRVESLYHFSPLNPLNLVSLRWLARRFGISDRFWTDIVVPMHSATFLTTRLDRIPAVIGPTIDAIVPLDAPARLETWRADSSEVFARMTAGFAERVHTNRPITRVTPDARGIELADAQGDVHRFDRVVLACPVPGSRGWLHDRLRLRTTWADDGDPTFRAGIVHGDPTVIAPDDRNRVLDECCNYIVVHREGDAIRYENHFVLSSWLPAVRGSRRPMLVTYGNSEAPAKSHREGSVDNRHAHPELSFGNLTRAILHRFLQGKDGIHYCGGLATPGNGHDLSLLSGLVVAEQIGAPHPFADDPDARADFERLRRIMI
jgi:predicted NAD/FAD-binding protein